MAAAKGYHALNKEKYEKADAIAAEQAVANLEKFREKMKTLGPGVGPDKEVYNYHSGRVVNHNVNYDINRPFYTSYSPRYDNGIDYR